MDPVLILQAAVAQPRQAIKTVAVALVAVKAAAAAAVLVVAPVRLEQALVRPMVAALVVAEV
tara:strand:- start:210 stop:395 length:186 start_codon:yes stop_codon:yes gene_type:complete